MHDIERLRIRFMDYVRETSGGKTNVYVATRPFMAENDIDLDMAFQLVKNCATNGWVTEASTMGNAGGFITILGIEEVQRREARRRDPALRSAAIRQALLRYVYEATRLGRDPAPISGFLVNDHSLFEGEQFETSEIDRACVYLEQKRLIKFAEGSLARTREAACTTPDGDDCIEQFDGDVQRYLNRNGGTGGMITNNFGAIHSAGPAVIGSSNVTINVTSNADPAALAEFARVLLDSLPELDLDEQVRVGVKDALEEMRDEAAQAAPEPGRLKAAMGKFTAYVADAGKPVLTTVFLALAHGAFGLPTN